VIFRSEHGCQGCCAMMNYFDDGLGPAIPSCLALRCFSFYVIPYVDVMESYMYLRRHHVPSDEDNWCMLGAGVSTQPAHLSVQTHWRSPRHCPRPLNSLLARGVVDDLHGSCLYPSVCARLSCLCATVHMPQRCIQTSLHEVSHPPNGLQPQAQAGLIVG
jgi:hypothetical protein